MRQTAKRLTVAFGALMLASSLAGADTLDELQADIDAGHFGAAAERANAYLRLHPGNRDARFLHARALAGQGKTEQATKAYEALAADFPLRAEPANNLAVLYAEQGKYENARQWLEKALATQPAYAVAHRNLGDVYTALADLAYRKALGTQDTATKTPLTMLDRFYYAHESVTPGARLVPAPRTSAATADRDTPAPKTQDSRSIIQTVRAWALAWSQQDFDAYTTFYADAFDPGDGLERADWLALRKARLARPERIRIHIDDPSIAYLAAGRARVDFVQRYDSPRYSDRVDKQLLLQRTRAGWRILRETSVPDS